MARKLDYSVFEKHINKFNSYKGSKDVRTFCNENNITRSQFYYYRKKLEERDNQKLQPVFHAITLNASEVVNDRSTLPLTEIKINIGKANITIPVSETNLISLIIKELASKC